MEIRIISIIYVAGITDEPMSLDGFDPSAISWFA